MCSPQLESGEFFSRPYTKREENEKQYDEKIALTVAAVLIGTVLLPAAVLQMITLSRNAPLKITAGSVLNGKAEEANEFSFSLCENGNVLETVGNGPAAEWIIGQPKTEDMIGTVDFTALTYTKENIGEHVYTVSETADTEKYSTNKATFTITVLVLDTENGLQTVVTSVKAQHGTNEKDLECLDLTASNLFFGNVPGNRSERLIREMIPLKRQQIRQRAAAQLHRQHR